MRPTMVDGSRRGLVVVSARAPFVQAGGGVARAPGGVISALLPLLRRTRGVWLATGADAEAAAASETAFEVRPIGLAPADREPWYAGACNGALWPLSHGFIERCRFREAELRAYRAVNRRAAEAIDAAASPGATVWIHDYQLALAPALLRARRPDLRIGFFWHIPWPSSDLLRVLPWAGELLEGVLGADVVGLHVAPYVRSFALALEERGLDHAEVGPGRLAVDLGRRSALVLACPIGTDVGTWARLARDPEVNEEASALRRSVGGARQLVAVDRLDYAKGVVERLEAFERALEATPSLRQGATLLQIGVPSRESIATYRDLRHRVETAVGRINGRFGSPSVTPVRFFATCMTSRALAAYYVAADAALVTPLRDGMNLVAFEYVASRRSTDGRLLLSTTAGAAEVLREAYLVNPYDEDRLAEAVGEMAGPPCDPRAAARMAALRSRVAESSVDAWVDRFLGELSAATGRPRLAAVNT
jgi:trehalose 6-phosphate synthase